MITNFGKSAVPICKIVKKITYKRYLCGNIAEMDTAVQSFNGFLAQIKEPVNMLSVQLYEDSILFFYETFTMVEDTLNA